MAEASVHIVANQGIPRAHDALSCLRSHLAEKGVRSSWCWADELPSCLVDAEAPSEGCDLIVVLGGDGTILRSARLAERLQAPLLGINFGHLGFLANPCTESVADMVDDALAGNARVERRANLRVLVEDGAGTRECFALNEVVVRSASGHIVSFALDVSGERVASMRADGVVVATATGSTAYALSAGGPLVSPSYEGLIVTPVAPHTLTSRALCTAHDEEVGVLLAEGYAEGDVALYFDGDSFPVDGVLRRISVRAGDRPTELLQVSAESFYRRVSEVFFH